MNIPVILKELAKVGVIALTEESVKSFVETKIKPIFANWGKDDLRSVELEDCLSEYLLRCYAKNNIMTTIVFGRLQKTLEDLYIPLTLEEYRNVDKKWVIDENCYDILDNYSRILIVDMAGMGKSTIVKYFACQGVNLNKCIPIVIELRRLEKNQSILEYIQTQINSLDKNIRIEEIVAILKKGDFVIFFDGYDEIANENKSDVLDAIQEFSDKATNTKIVITSREEDDLNSLGGYKCVNIKPLTKEDAYNLIEKYDYDGEISKKLIKKLKKDSSMDVLKEFLENPLLVSLLYKTFEYKEEIPYKKIDFYEQVYAALFSIHNKTKGSSFVYKKKTNLDEYQFAQILCRFAFLSVKIDKMEYSFQLINQLLERSVEVLSLVEVYAGDYLYDLIHVIPLIQKEGNNYKWIHKSFMEYFASCFICNSRALKDIYLKKMAFSNNSNRYYNLLDFCYELDTLGFKESIILPSLKRFVEIYEEYVQKEVFNEFGFKYVNMLIQLLFFIENAHFIKIKYDLEKDIEESCLKDDFFEAVIKVKRSFKEKIRENYSIISDKGYTLIFFYECKNYTLYKILKEKFPEIFKEIFLKENADIQMAVVYKLEEIINKPIEKEYFKIIESSCSIIFSDNKIIVYDKCKRMIKEIELEILDNNIFDF